MNLRSLHILAEIMNAKRITFNTIRRSRRSGVLKEMESRGVFRNPSGPETCRGTALIMKLNTN